MRKALERSRAGLLPFEISVQPIRCRSHQSPAYGAAGLHLSDRADGVAGDPGGESLHHRVGISERRVRVRAGIRHCGQSSAGAGCGGGIRGLPVCRGAAARSFRPADRMGAAAVCAVFPALSANWKHRRGSRVWGVDCDRGVCRLLPRRLPGYICARLHDCDVGCRSHLPRASAAVAAAVHHAADGHRAHGG